MNRFYLFNNGTSALEATLNALYKSTATTTTTTRRLNCHY